MPLTLATLGIAALLAGAGLPAQTAEDPAHAELRALRDELVDAVNQRDLPRLLRHLHPDVVVTWQNAEVSRHPDGVRAYLTRMLEGPNSIVQSFSTTVNVDEKSHEASVRLTATDGCSWTVRSDANWIGDASPASVTLTPDRLSEVSRVRGRSAGSPASVTLVLSSCSVLSSVSPERCPRPASLTPVLFR